MEQRFLAGISFIVVCAILVILGVNYFIMPTYNLSFVGIYFLAYLAILAFALILLDERGKAMVVTLGAGGFALLVCVSFVTTSRMINADRYRNLIGEVEQKDFKTALPPIDIHNTPLVSEHMAERSALKKLSDIPALGSQVVLSRFTKQNIKGKLYWVSFLEHSGFLKWNNTGFTPGYIKVSAVNSEDVEFVQEVDGKKLQMRYLDSAYFGDNAQRRIYQQNKTVGISDLSNEVDDNGTPYLVATLYDKSIGFSGSNAVGLATLNVQTGVVKNYDMDSIPSWVDRVQPEKFIESQISDWGELIHGWWNPSDQGKLMISDHIDFVYGEDGNCYYYLGISSINAKDDGISGFMLINSRTKKTTLYYLSGASEYVAAKTVVDSMPEKKYHSTNPLPFNVDGTPTYIMTLTDENGIPRAFGMVSVSDFKRFAVAENLKATLRLYQNKLAQRGSGGLPNDLDQKNEPSIEELGVVSRIGSDVLAGTTTYYLTLTTSSRIFTAGGDLSEKLALTRPGDTVVITHEKNDEKLTIMSHFENKSIK